MKITQKKPKNNMQEAQGSKKTALVMIMFIRFVRRSDQIYTGGY